MVELFAVHADQCSFDKDEGILSVEAGGDLGFPPGEFPLQIELVYESGQKTKLRRWGPFYHGEGDDRELAGFKYVTDDSGEHILTMWND